MMQLFGIQMQLFINTIIKNYESKLQNYQNWKKYFPQSRFQHVVTSEKGDIQPIHDWIYFKNVHGEDQWFNTYEDALDACIEDEDTEVFDEITEIEINHGKVVKEQKIL